MMPIRAEFNAITQGATERGRRELVGLRIGIDGAQSTGKTTLFRSLQDTFRDTFKFIPEASRIVAPRFGVRHAEDWPKLLKNSEELAEFFYAEEEWQMAAETSHRFICDSTLILIQAYRKYFGLNVREKSMLEDRYDIIFFCPAITSYEPDGFRFVEGRQKIEEIYLELVSSAFHGKLVRLSPGPHRVRQAVATIVDQGRVGEG